MLTLYSDLSKSIFFAPQAAAANGRHEIAQRISSIHLRREPTSFAHSVRQPWKLGNKVLVKCVSSQGQSLSDGVSEEKKSINKTTAAISSSEVQSLLTNICDTTSIAEFKLNLGSFHLYVKRDLNGSDSSTPLQIFPQVHVETSTEIPALNGSVSVTSLVVSRPEPSSGGIQRYIDAASDEGLVMLQSPKVGLFRRSRTIKGKRAPLSCSENHQVKEGQVICFIEQLGGEIPIESDVTGEVIKILRKDGEPVGFGDALIAILPSFPGIKKLQLPA